MISIDTNVLIRDLVEDDAEQVEATRSLLDSLTIEDPGFVCREVILEISWVLASAYRFTREQIGEALLRIIGMENLLVETSDDVARSARHYGENNDDFSDLMILEASRRMGALPLYTFDRRLSRMEGAALVGA